MHRPSSNIADNLKKYTYGIPDRSLAIHERAKKVVAGPHHIGTATHWHPGGDRWGFSHSSFHLFGILMRRKPPHKEYETILVITVGFGLLYAWLEHAVLLYLSVGLGTASLLSPLLRRWIVWVWEKLAFALGYVNSRVLLTLVFYLILTPVALLSRLFSSGHRPSSGEKTTSYFTTRHHTFSPKDMENPW